MLLAGVIAESKSATTFRWQQVQHHCFAHMG